MSNRGNRATLLPVVHLLMFISTVLVSTSFIVGKAITAELDPSLLTFFRFSLATLLFAPWVHFKYGFRYSRSLFCRSALISVCLVIFFFCMFLSLRYTSVLNTSVIFALVPSISCLYSLILVKEVLKKAHYLALGCGVIGVIWVIFRGDISSILTMQMNRGDLIFLGGSLALGFYAPLVKLFHRQEPMAVMTFWVLLTGVFWLLPLTVEGLINLDWAEVPGQTWLGISYLSVFTTIITFFINQYSIVYLGPTRVTAYSYMYPAIVLILELILGQGRLSLRVVPGVLVVLSAMFVLMRVKD